MKIYIDLKDLDISLQEICLTDEEYRNNKAMVNEFLKTKDVSKLSLKLRGFLRDYLIEAYKQQPEK